MGYNHSKAEYQFKKTWIKLKKDYKEAGMSDEAIAAMYEFDKEVFKRNRAYKEKTESLLPETFDEVDDDESKLIRPELVDYGENLYSHSRYWWIEELDDPVLADCIKHLSKKDTEILTLLAFENYEQTVIAKYMGISASAINQRIKRIERIIKKLKKIEKK